MSLFSIFKRKKDDGADTDFNDFAEKLIAEFQENDFLGKAAEAGHKAKDAVKARKYNDAWRFYNDQKLLYMRHANRSGFTPEQTLALDSTVHEKMADIRRLEGKHTDALIDIVYWVLAGSKRPINRHSQKLQAYFNRCKFENTSLADAQVELANQKALPEFTLAKSIVSNWASRG